MASLAFKTYILLAGIPGYIITTLGFLIIIFLADQAASRKNLLIALIVSMFAFLAPQGYILGLIIGTGLYYLSKRLVFFTQV